MALLDSLGEKLAKAGKTAIKTSGDILEVTRLNLFIKSEEEKIRDYMTNIGNRVYEYYKEGRPMEEEFSPDCEGIFCCERNIEELKKKVLEIKNLRMCSGCSAKIDNMSLYCPKCGMKVEE